MKKKSLIYFILCLAICLLPVLLLPVKGNQTASENRKLAEAPSFTDAEGRFNVNVLSDAGAYFEDHFGLRNEWVTAYGKILANCFGVSSQNGVILGKNDWLYYKDSLTDYQGGYDLNDRQLFDAAWTIRMIQEEAEAEDIDFAFMIAPNKNSLYDQNMPYYYTAYREDHKNYDRLMPLLAEYGINVADVKSVLTSDEYKDEILYHARDSHWNNKGAALAAQTVLDASETEHPVFTDRKETVKEDFTGDLDAMIFPAAMKPEAEIYYEPACDFTYVEEVESNFSPQIYTESNSENGSLLMYRDSFGNALVPFMAESFTNSHFSRGIPYQITDDIYADECETLIIERAERFIPELAMNAPRMLAPVITSRQLGERNYEKSISGLAEEESDIYTIITGDLPENIPADARIFIRVNGEVNYEAFPVTDESGKESFSLMLITELLSENNTYELCLVPASELAAE